MARHVSPNRVLQHVSKQTIGGNSELNAVLYFWLESRKEIRVAGGNAMLRMKDACAKLRGESGARIDCSTILGTTSFWVGCVSLSLLAISVPAWAVDIDGRIDPLEYQGAQHVTDFRKVQPLNGEPASLTTEAWILATHDGLAVAFRNTQPPEVPLTRQRVQRDFEDQVDRINVMIDFDGDHRTGYDFTLSSTDGVFDAVITNEAQFNKDWDGNWQHAVAEDELGWTAEVLIPWHIASMRSAKGDTRTMAIYLDRVVGMTGERAAWPLASFERPRFLSDFAPITVAKHSSSLLALTPYVSGFHDNIDGSSKLDGGLDVFWKPNGQVQLTGTVNPDFGQVESDDLVVNFDATETFISDKRPFFTENQGLFEFTTPSDYSQLLYTRRVGGPADDGNGSGDIIAALKLNGSVGDTKYGLFAATEAEEVGRSFAALRVVRDFTNQNLGFMATAVDRPFYDRNATVAGIDHNWRPTARLNIRTRLIGSSIQENGENTLDSGATVMADYEMDDGWRQQWMGLHFGNELQLNDAGYLARNNLNYLHWQASRRFTNLPADSRYASKDWRWRVTENYNDHGQQLSEQFRMSRQSRLRNGSFEYAQININSAGKNDLLTRGHGAVNLPPNFNAFARVERPRKGNWAYEGEVEIYSGGLAGNDLVGYWIQLTPAYFINDSFNFYIGVGANHTPDWLIWQYDNLIGSFDGRETDFNAGFNWTISNKQELRLKLQSIGVNARVHQGYRVDALGTAVPTTEAIDDFSVRNFAFQIRYRYELAPLSYLYIVYGRGGYEEVPYVDEPGNVMRDSFRLRDDDQILIKLSYRFEI
jgi:hypothetical protein